jgi:hypothetical protein
VAAFGTLKRRRFFSAARAAERQEKHRGGKKLHYDSFHAHRIEGQSVRLHTQGINGL